MPSSRKPSLPPPRAGGMRSLASASVPPAGPGARDPLLRLAEAERRAELLAAALAEALAAAARLRARAAHWRRRLRASEIARTTGTVRLAVAEAELAEARAALAAAREARVSAESEAAHARAQRAAAHARTAALEAELRRARAPSAARAAPAENVAAALAVVERGELRVARGGRAGFAEPSRAPALPLDAVLPGDAAANGAAPGEGDDDLSGPPSAPAGRGARGASGVPGAPGEAEPAGALGEPEAAGAADEAELASGPGEPEAAGAAGANGSGGPGLGGLRRTETPPSAPGTGSFSPNGSSRPEPAGRGASPSAVPPPAPARSALAGGILARRLREQAQATAAVARPAPAVADEVAAQLDAAAAALRAPRPDVAPAPDGWLRGALARLAAADPVLAGEILAGLLPAQGLAVAATLDYDLTIGGVGTFGVSLAGGRARVVALDAPRGRRRAEFHLRGEPLALAELLAGATRRPHRLTGPLRLAGRRRPLEALLPLARAPISLADAVRAGAALAPRHVLALLPHAIAPEWTRGHRFAIALAAPGAQGRLVVADGAPVVLAPGPGPADASVAFPAPATLLALLRDEPAPPGLRPVVRGDRAAVAVLSGWLDRARGRGRRP